MKKILLTIFWMLFSLFILSLFSIFLLSARYSASFPPAVASASVNDRPRANESELNLEETKVVENLDNTSAIETEIIENEAEFLIKISEKQEKQVATPKCPEGNIAESKIDFYFNANRKNSLGNFTPTNLIPLSRDYTLNSKFVCLSDRPSGSLVEMLSAAKDDGFELKVVSGYRSIKTQTWLYENWIRRNPGATGIIAVAEPSHSEHQLGTTVDLTSAKLGETGISRAFANTSEYKWLSENAAHFGFVESYPVGNEEKTGYFYEPWHWRYIGEEIAGAVKANNILLMEYLETSH